MDDDDDFLSRRPVKKGSAAKPAGNDDIFSDMTSKGSSGNKAKKDWSILDKKDATGKFHKSLLFHSIDLIY